MSDVVTELNITLDVDSGSVEVVHTSSNQIVANYDSAYYDVQITNLNDQWLVSVSGKAAKIGETIRNTPATAKEKNVAAEVFRIVSSREHWFIS